MKEIKSAFDVFKTQGQPTITYVQRTAGTLEKRLESAINNKGTIVLLTGPSKTGKTTLYKKVLEDNKLVPLEIRCDSGLTPVCFWKQGLESINFERMRSSESIRASETELSGGVEGTIGWKWLAGLTGKVGTKFAGKNQEEISKERILADPSPRHLIPILKQLPIILVIEDFHYLNECAQKVISQQWKLFTDEEISIIIVGTTHHAVDLVNANRDLIGRTAHIETSTWNEKDLEKICRTGYKALNFPITEENIRLIASESVGLPIVTQATSLQLLINEKYDGDKPKGKGQLGITKKDIYKALHQVAIEKYGQFETIYDRITCGPRKKARKYDTYELVLSAFSQDPWTFSLKKSELLARLRDLPIEENKFPPNGSINATLKALKPFQDKINHQILEWSPPNDKLYIIEPTFLFYLRWRKERDTTPTIIDLFKELFSDPSIIITELTK